MYRAVRSSIKLGSVAICLFGCAPDAPIRSGLETASLSDAVPSPAMAAAAYSGWSTPMNLGGTVNSTSNEQNAQLSKDGLSIYFTSDRPGGLGGLDIWVTRRASPDSPWEPPVNLGAAINTASADFAPNLSIDGHLLFFASNRSGGQGAIDLYMSRRHNPNDDKAWSEPVNLGPGVNTTDNEQAPNYLQNAEEAGGNLYFNRGVNAANTADLYYVAVSRDGVATGPAVNVIELNTPISTEAAASLRHDAKEVFFGSTRAGGQGAGDIWTSTRQNANDSWSPPVNVGSVNTSFNDVTPNLSFDGLTMLLGSNRPGGSGGNDLWITTRTRH
jgi:WD40 repeat protein